MQLAYPDLELGLKLTRRERPWFRTPVDPPAPPNSGYDVSLSKAGVAALGDDQAARSTI